MGSPIRTAGPATYAAGSRRPDLQFDAEEELSESNYTLVFLEANIAASYSVSALSKFILQNYSSAWSCKSGLLDAAAYAAVYRLYNLIRRAPPLHQTANLVFSTQLHKQQGQLFE